MSLNRAPDAQARSTRVSSCRCGCVTRARRYPSDLTDAEWAVLAPLLPTPACQTPGGGRPETHERRTVLNAIFYVIDNGIKWRAMPGDFPPWRTIHSFYARWSDSLATAELVDRLRTDLRTALGRNPTPSAGCMDAQSVHECAEGVVPKATSGYDPHKRVNGRKRHILVDTLGLLIAVHVTAANIQDRDAARILAEYAALTGITHIWADNAYHGELITWALAILTITIDIVARQPGTKGFQALPRRWVVERTLAWITRRRRCARDYERLPDHHETAVHWAAIIHMTRRRARLPYHQTPNQV